jgi:cyclic beta-1,2-glucan synthetase
VIAPYASALAAHGRPGAALANLAALERQGALGRTASATRSTTRARSRASATRVVGNYMAHHIGMSLVALTNVLTGNVWQRRFHADPLVRSAELLLHERIPRRLVLQEPQPRARRGAPGPGAGAPRGARVRRPDTPRRTSRCSAGCRTPSW